MNGWEFLGLRPDADARAIKRAYASQLRSVRPDVDPKGFQQLHDAYQWALEQARQRDSELGTALAESDTGSATIVAEPPSTLPLDPPFHGSTDAAAVDSTIVPAQVVDGIADLPSAPAAIGKEAISHAPTGAPSLDFGAFYSHLVETALAGDAEAVRQLLEGEPAFWSIALKRDFADGLVHRLFHDEPPMPAAALDAILAFFDLDHVLSDVDPLYLNHLRRRLHLAWELRRSHHQQLSIRLREKLGPKPPRETAAREFPRYLQRLSQPLRWLDGLGWMLWSPSHTGRTGHFIARLDGGRIDALPESLDRPNLLFWLHAGDSETPSLPRLAMDLAHWLAWTLRIVAVMALLGFLIDILVDVPAGKRSGWMTLGGIGLAACLLWLAYLVWKLTLQWQCLPQDPLERGRWLRVAFIPMLLGLAWALFAAPVRLAPIVMALFALTIAALRYRRRAGIQETQFEFWWLFLLYPISKIATAMGDLTLIALIGGTGITLGLWATDLWTYHAALRRPKLTDPEQLES